MEGMSGDINRKRNDGRRDGLRWGLKQMTYPIDTSASSNERDASRAKLSSQH